VNQIAEAIFGNSAYVADNVENPLKPEVLTFVNAVLAQTYDRYKKSWARSKTKRDNQITEVEQMWTGTARSACTI
jgi:hypothetical protein